MHVLTALLSCLLSLFGLTSQPSTTSITRVAGTSGDATLFSKTTLADGVATFECFASASGGCHYRIYEEDCMAAPAAGAAAGSACRRQTLDTFALQVGQQHRVEGLPAGFRHCVAQGEADHCD